MAPTQEEFDDLLLSCRYGEVEEVSAFALAHGWAAVASVKDERGNTPLHMCCGNGHVGESARIHSVHKPAWLLTPNLIVPIAVVSLANCSAPC